MRRVLLTIFLCLGLLIAGFATLTYLDQTRAPGSDAFLDQEGAIEFLETSYEKAVSLVGFSARSDESLSLDDALPSAVEGWKRLHYEKSHGITITGAPSSGVDEPRSTEDFLQRDFLAALDEPLTRIAKSYVRGNEIVAIYAEIFPKSADGTTATQVSEESLDILDFKPTFMIADGVEFFSFPYLSTDFVTGETTQVAYRRFEGSVGDRLKVKVFTNARNDDVRQVIDGIDFDSLIILSSKPLPKVTEEAPIVTAGLVAVAPVATQDTAELEPVEEVSMRDKFRTFFLGAQSEKRVTLKCSKTSSGFKRCRTDD